MREERAGQDLPREHSLDELAKGLATGHVSRGRALKLMGGAFLGGVLASIPGVALAAPKKPGTGPCRPEQFQCGKKCCPDVASCVKGECVCPTGTELVNGQCVTVGPCPPGTVLLSNGTCAISCGEQPGNPECANCESGCFAHYEGGEQSRLGLCAGEAIPLEEASCEFNNDDCPQGSFCIGRQCVTACLG